MKSYTYKENGHLIATLTYNYDKKYVRIKYNDVMRAVAAGSDSHGVKKVSFDDFTKKEFRI